MKRMIAATVLTLVFAALVSGAPAVAQDLHREYALGAGGKISIRNVSGDLKVTGYGGNSVVVNAVRTGRDRDLVQVVDQSAGNQIDLRVQYPENCNCEAGVNFEVQVPANVAYSFENLTSVSGDVQISGVRGNLKAQSVSGDVTVASFSGIANASSVSGDVEVEISGLVGAGDMKFSTVSGGVAVRAPGGANLDIAMSTLSGSLETDFPIQIEEKKFGPGRSAKGRVGSGGTSLHISAVSGDVRLFRN